MYNIRQREINRPAQYLRSLTKVEENVNKPRSNTRDKQIPALVLTNCRSITLDKLDELKLFIESKHPQIVMLTESWLNKSKEQTRCIDDFQLLTSIRSSGRVGGGVAMFVHDSLNAKVVHQHTTKKFSTLWVNITYHHRSVIYGCVYHPKSKKNSDSEEILKHLSETLVKLSTKYTDQFVIGEDFNHLDISDITNNIRAE